VIFLFKFVSRGQKCKYDKEEKDDFSGNVKKSIETKLYHDHKIFGEPDGRGSTFYFAIWFNIVKDGKNVFLETF